MLYKEKSKVILVKFPGPKGDFLTLGDDNKNIFIEEFTFIGRDEEYLHWIVNHVHTHGILFRHISVLITFVVDEEPVLREEGDINMNAINLYFWGYDKKYDGWQLLFNFRMAANKDGKIFINPLLDLIPGEK